MDQNGPDRILFWTARTSTYRTVYPELLLRKISLLGRKDYLKRKYRRKWRNKK